MSRINYARLVRTGRGLHVWHGSRLPGQSIPAALALCTAMFVATACGGASITTDQRDRQLVQRDVTSGMGTGRLDKIACTGSQCRVATTYAFHSMTEASLVAVPIVFFVNTDDLIPKVRRLSLKITSPTTNETAAFDCHLTRPTTSGSFDVTSLHRICTTSSA